MDEGVTVIVISVATELLELELLTLLELELLLVAELLELLELTLLLEVLLELTDELEELVLELELEIELDELATGGVPLPPPPPPPQASSDAHINASSLIFNTFFIGCSLRQTRNPTRFPGDFDQIPLIGPSRCCHLAFQTGETLPGAAKKR